jgi:hypothetical protein
VGNACYHYGQSLLPSCLLSKNFEIKIYKTIILPFVLYRRETWSLTLKEEYTLSVFNNRVMTIFGPKWEEVTKAGEDYIMRSFITCTLHQILLG